MKNFPIQGKVYKQLQVVLEQTNEKLFDNHSSTLCENLHNSIVTNDFVNYFNSYWVPCKKKQDYYYRADLDITTNMFCEAFHDIFKYMYLKGKKVKKSQQMFDEFNQI